MRPSGIQTTQRSNTKGLKLVETSNDLAYAARYRDEIQYPLRRALHASGIHYRFSAFNPKSYTTCAATTNMRVVDSEAVDVGNLVKSIDDELQKQRMFLGSASTDSIHYVKIQASNKRLFRVDVVLSFQKGSLSTLRIASQPVGYASQTLNRQKV